MIKKYLIIIFYFLFILCGSLSLIFIPNVLSYSYGSILSLFIISLPLFFFLVSKYGWNTFLKLIISLSVFALLIEYTGLVTGWPYGEFTYTAHLGYKIFGILPWTVGFSWAPLVIGSVAIVYTTTQNKFLRIILPVLVLLIFDLLFDPVAVKLGMWSYISGGDYYNVPLQNFLGWIFSGLIGSLISFSILNKYPKDNIIHLSYSFFISIVFWCIVALGFGLTVPFYFGLILALYFIVIYYKNNE